jgi:hypothetical protein
MIDSFFTIGSSHYVCQDYMLSGFLNENQGYVILCDGCSTAIDSDFGARLLAKAAEMVLKHEGVSPDQENFGSKVIEKAFDAACYLNIPKESLAATLLIAVQDTESVKTYLAGDGVIAAKTRTGDIVVYIYDSDNNAPYYLKYLIDPSSRQDYFDLFGKTLNCKEYLIDKNFNAKMLGKTSMPCEVPARIEFRNDDFEFVAIMSDGSLSFLANVETETSKTNKIIDINLILKELFSFKNFTKGFVKRRCQMAWKKFHSQGWYNFDDFSIGVIKTPEKESNNVSPDH